MIISKIQNFRGIKKAEFELEPGLTGFFGQNGSGKSSIAESLASAFSSQTLPIKGILKKDAIGLVNETQRKGSVKITGEDGERSIHWPDCEAKSTGTPPFSSDIAVGLRRLSQIAPKELPPILASYMDITPTKEDVAEALKEIKIAETSIDKIWESLDTIGWDTTCKNVETKSSALKGQWKEVAQKNYGSKIAENWIPEDYSSDMEANSEEFYSTKVSEAQEFLEAALKSEAISEDKIDALTASAKKIPDFENQISVLREKGKAAKTKLVDSQKELEGLPLPTTEPNSKCPLCKGDLILANNKISAPEKITKVENTRREKVIHLCNSEIESAEKELKQIKTEGKSLTLELTQCESDYNTLDSMPTIKPGGGDVEKARNELSDAKLVLDSFVKKYRADKIQRQILKNKEILEIISPTGLRQEKLSGAISEFNDVIKTILPELKIEFNSKLEIELNERPRSLLSESQDYQCDIAFQLAIAHLDKSQAIIIDRLDIFDNSQKKIILKALKKSKKYCIICSTTHKKEKAPDFKKMKHGISYWIEDGEIKEV